jgi:hypothetical protein
MRVTDVRTWALHADVPSPTFSSHPGLITGRDSTVIEIITDEGISGFGESLCQNRQPGQIAQTVIETVLVDVIRGANPLDTAVLWETMITRRIATRCPSSTPFARRRNDGRCEGRDPRERAASRDTKVFRGTPPTGDSPYLQVETSAAGRIRTCDPRIKSPLLCQLSYGGGAP